MFGQQKDKRSFIGKKTGKKNADSEFRTGKVSKQIGTNCFSPRTLLEFNFVRKNGSIGGQTG
jgi:hypothetical protein